MQIHWTEVPTTPHKRKADLRNLEEPDAMESDGDSDTLFHVKAKSNLPPLEVVVTIDKKKVKMEVDTGATYSLMSKVTFDRLWAQEESRVRKQLLIIYCQEAADIVNSDCFASSDQPYLCVCAMRSQLHVKPSCDVQSHLPLSTSARISQIIKYHCIIISHSFL